MKDLGNTLRSLRKNHIAEDGKKVSMEKLARISGLTFQTVRNLEKERSAPNLTSLELYLEALGYELEIKKKESE